MQVLAPRKRSKVSYCDNLTEREFSKLVDSGATAAEFEKAQAQAALRKQVRVCRTKRWTHPSFQSAL